MEAISMLTSRRNDVHRSTPGPRRRWSRRRNRAQHPDDDLACANLCVAGDENPDDDLACANLCVAGDENPDSRLRIADGHQITALQPASSAFTAEAVHAEDVFGSTPRA